MNDIPALIFVLLRLAMAAALYTFLGWSMMLLWRDLNTQKETQTKQVIPSIRLRRTNEAGQPEVLRYNLSQIFIGRDQNNDCVLINETVSGKHARLIFQASQWWVEDLQSRNGTYLNESPLEMPIVLTSGDHIRCGEVQIDIEIDVE